MDELDPKSGGFLGHVVLPMADIAWLIADARSKLPKLSSDELEKMLATIQVRVEYLQSLATRLDQTCRDCPLGAHNTTLEDAMDLAFGQDSYQNDEPDEDES